MLNPATHIAGVEVNVRPVQALTKTANDFLSVPAVRFDLFDRMEDCAAGLFPVGPCLGQGFFGLGRGALGVVTAHLRDSDGKWRRVGCGDGSRDV